MSTLAPGRHTLLSGNGRCWLLIACLILTAAPVQAHLLNMSRVNIQLLDQHRVLVTAQLDLTRAFGSAAAYFSASQVTEPLSDRRIVEQLRLAANAIDLRVGDVRVHLTPISIAFVEQTLADYQSPLEWPRATVRFEGRLAAASSPQHSGVRVRFDDGFVFEEPIATTLQSSTDEQVVSRWLVTFQSSPQLKAPRWFSISGLQPASVRRSSDSNAFGRYFSLGFWHIIPGGIDHLLFVLAIVLGMPTLRALLISLSLYTVAHSLSFAAATLGWLPPGMFGVEPLIALSIVFCGLVNFRDRTPAVNHAVMTFAFGLLHGLGFASALGEAGLPVAQRLLSLLGFNFGVESAQLLFVVLITPLWWCRRFYWYPNRIRKPVSMIIVLTAVSWFIGLAR